MKLIPYKILSLWPLSSGYSAYLLMSVTVNLPFPIGCHIIFHRMDKPQMNAACAVTSDVNGEHPSVYIRDTGLHAMR